MAKAVAVKPEPQRPDVFLTLTNEEAGALYDVLASHLAGAPTGSGPLADVRSVLGELIERGDVTRVFHTNVNPKGEDGRYDRPYSVLHRN